MQSFRAAWDTALYGPGGRFRCGRRDFSTAFTDPVCGATMAMAIGRLAHQVDAALGHPDPFDVVDVGAGTGAWLAHLATDPATPSRWSLHGIECAPRPADLDDRIGWGRLVPDCTGLLVAHEWLDNVAIDVTHRGRVMLADGSAGPTPGSADVDWLQRWWPHWQDGDAECGRRRDEAWQEAVGHLHRGLALAVDYGHTRGARRPTLIGYRDGRATAPAPDASCDITAHVALDAIAAVVSGSTVRSQRDCLSVLGMDGRLPPAGAPHYASALREASAAASLCDPAGFGNLGWVLAPIGLDGQWPRPSRHEPHRTRGSWR